MNIDSLRMFCRVAEEGSVSQAARLGFISQPAVTKQIRQLENRYGTSLFDRMDGKLTLSEAGKVLYPYAKEMVELDNNSFQAIQEVSGYTDQTLKVGASQTIGEYLLPGLLGNYQKRHEGIKFSLLIGNTPYILSKLDNNEIDIALVEGEADQTKYTVQKFADDELILITSYNHRWKDKGSIEVHELSEEKMIWREKDSGTRLIVENALSELGILEYIENAMELGSMQSIKSAVEANLGIGIMPKLTVTKELQFKVLREIPIKNLSIMRDLWIVQKDKRFKKSAQIGFQEFLLR
ncbi:LysR family transcriptional regulator [Bacillus infantis]|uniref:LysR family transcriptional regulator n=2 Tax=Bacillus infantis TaxID=324767 RepID=A0A5D4RIQ3_9BACI|nr:LysR family transcriptional regulator [Bacillus infantis]